MTIDNVGWTKNQLEEENENKENMSQIARFCLASIWIICLVFFFVKSRVNASCICK